jgi:F-type H+-transporting ATPase subunit b
MPRTRFFLAACVLSLLSYVSHPVQLRGQEPKQHEAGAAQPEPQEQNPNAPNKREGGEADEVKNSPPIHALARLTGLENEKAYWVSVFLNFGVVILIIAWLVKKNVPGMFKARTESIQKRMEEARQASEEARRRLSEVEGRLSRLDAEIEGMRREAQENARSEEVRIQSEVEDERRRIVSGAEQEIDAAASAARRELKAYAASLAVDLAEKRIKVGQDTDQMLVREFTSQLGKDGH